MRSIKSPLLLDSKKRNISEGQRFDCSGCMTVSLFIGVVCALLMNYHLRSHSGSPTMGLASTNLQHPTTQSNSETALLHEEIIPIMKSSEKLPDDFTQVKAVRKLPKRSADDASIPPRPLQQDQMALSATQGQLATSNLQYGQSQNKHLTPIATDPSPSSLGSGSGSGSGSTTLQSFTNLVNEFVGAVSSSAASLTHSTSQSVSAHSTATSTPSTSTPSTSTAPDASTSIETTSTISKSTCTAKYGSSRRFFAEREKRSPPMLYTFPGSGNTWGRLLIEHATGIYSGSVYNDKALLEALPGEFTCNFQVSVIKVHPHTHPGIELVDGSFNSDDHKCIKSNFRKFERALLLVRDPFDSIWSEYQRRFSQNHVLGIRNETFDWYRWTANAANLANGYFEMWAYHYSAIERTLRQRDIMFLRYEDLKSKTRRVETLRKVAEFLHVKANPERLECAFLLAENSHAHRRIDPATMMTKDIAYTRQITCRMWALFGKFALRVGYPLSGARIRFNCTGFPPIRKVNVGGSGEFNPLWVRPGDRPIDFGEHPPSNFVWGTVQRPRGLEDMWIINGEKVLIRHKPKPPSMESSAVRNKGASGSDGDGGFPRDRRRDRRVRERGGDGGQENRRPKAKDYESTEAAMALATSSDAKKQVRVDKSRASAEGMALKDAMDIDGVGTVGQNKPAWL